MAIISGYMLFFKGEDARTVVTMTVVVAVCIIRRAHVVHLVCRAALHAAGDGFLTGQLEMRISFSC